MERGDFLQLGKDASQAVMDDKISLTVIGRGVPVDQHQPVTPVVAQQTSGGIDSQTGAGDHQKIGVTDRHDAFLHRVLVKPFFIEHHVGLHDAAALVAAGYAVADAGQLLEFVGGDVVASYDMFDKVVDAYNQDAKYIDMLISDFSATSEELLASIDGVLSSMDGIATATNEGAKGTTDIAQKTIDVKAEADEVTSDVAKCDETARRLNEEISVFKVD